MACIDLTLSDEDESATAQAPRLHQGFPYAQTREQQPQPQEQCHIEQQGQLQQGSQVPGSDRPQSSRQRSTCTVREDGGAVSDDLDLSFLKALSARHTNQTSSQLNSSRSLNAGDRGSLQPRPNPSGAADFDDSGDADLLELHATQQSPFMQGPLNTTRPSSRQQSGSPCALAHPPPLSQQQQQTQEVHRHLSLQHSAQQRPKSQQQEPDRIWTDSDSKSSVDHDSAAPRGGQNISRGGDGGSKGTKRAAQALREARAEERKRKGLAKENEKEAKRLAKEQSKLERAAAKEHDKLNKKHATEVQRALKGSNVEKDMVLHMSGKMVELPWGATLLEILREQGIEYKIEASLGPLSIYAWVRWGRRMPRAAAQAFMEQQSQAAAPQQNGHANDASLVNIYQAMELLPAPPDQPSEAELAFQLLVVFLPPGDLVSQLLPGNNQVGNNSRDTLLKSLRTAVRAALPECTLMVGCVGLSRYLDAAERAPGSLFNRGTVEEALLDLAMRYPAVRLRTDLVDGAQAADVLVTTTTCLANHHKRQQDGYLKSFGTSRLPSSHGSLEDANPACKVTANALCHLLPPDKAVAVALKYQSMGGLMAAYAAQNTQKAKEEMLVGLNLGTGRGVALGKKASQDVYRFLHCLDPAAQAKDD